MTLEKYSQLFKRYVKKTFNTNQEAADHYDCDPSMVSNVKAGRRNPTEAMLASTGHEFVTTIRKVKS